MDTIDDLVEFLEHALGSDARGRLVDTGEAWSIVRREGVVPTYGPSFRPTLDADLAEYGFALLDAGLALNDLARGHHMARRAFVTAGRTFESLVRNGAPDDPERGFLRVMAAASYHLGSYTAIAYALSKPLNAADHNLNTAEACLVQLMLRDLDGVRATARQWLLDREHDDGTIAERMQRTDGDLDHEYALVLISCVCRALATYEFALRTGSSQVVTASRETLSAALQLAAAAGMPTLWWVTRLTLGLLDDLWNQSLHVVLPPNLLTGGLATYTNLRTVYIASLCAGSVAEVELWPSQVDAARRAADPTDDLVVALPTSAGKTRIAELAILTALAMEQRVVVVTPLRALSAQSERILRSRFAPLGATVSSLYGKSGLSGSDESTLRSHTIVVATPEKLDFALRSDPDVIADVGLIVFDEGHFIGPGEREIHYEVLIQRLLRRADAAGRRIVCLSAILPDGEDLEDMTAWLRSGAEGQPVRSDWRPTRQRYGTIEWRGASGRLNYDLQSTGPFVARFVRSLPARGRERKPYPRALNDATLISAWSFAEEGKHTMIFVTQANWVAGYAKRVVHLVARGYLGSLLEDEEAIETATRIGDEWLGHDHPAVQCLRYGVAVHHGKLPSPFLREVERLLASGKIKLTVASPTLAQGLNLNAAVLLVPYLVRAGRQIASAELANVAGRAGRAFVDTEGLILHVMDDQYAWRRSQWRKLVKGVQQRSLRSGVITVVHTVIQRLARNGMDSNGGYEYLANAREAWSTDADDDDSEAIEDLVAKIDAIILGLVDALDADEERLPEILDESLVGSLWERQLEREDAGVRRDQMRLLTARARLIWRETTAIQRRGHFAMGVGMETGLEIDQMAEMVEEDLDQADVAALRGNKDDLYEAIIRLARRLLNLRPFAPETLNGVWPGVLRKWVGGVSLSAIDSQHVGLIEDAFTYRLVWALEAIRVRRVSRGWDADDGTIPGAAAACVDTGLPDYRMTLLVRGGLTSREAAQKVVNDLDPIFFDRGGMREWLSSTPVADLSKREDWPTRAAAPLWRRFRMDILKGPNRVWRSSSESLDVAEVYDDIPRDPALTRLETDHVRGGTWLTAPDFRRVAWLDVSIDLEPHSVVYAELDAKNRTARVHRIGPDVSERFE